MQSGSVPRHKMGAMLAFRTREGHLLGFFLLLSLDCQGSPQEGHDLIPVFTRIPLAAVGESTGMGGGREQAGKATGEERGSSFGKGSKLRFFGGGEIVLSHPVPSSFHV